MMPKRSKLFLLLCATALAGACGSYFMSGDLLLFPVCLLLLVVSVIPAPIFGLLCLLDFIKVMDDAPSRLRHILLGTAICSGLPLVIPLLRDAFVNHDFIPFLTRLDGRRLFTVEMALAFSLAILLGEILGRVLSRGRSWSNKSYFKFIAIFWVIALYLSLPSYFAAISLMTESTTGGSL